MHISFKVKRLALLFSAFILLVLVASDDAPGLIQETPVVVASPRIILPVDREQQAIIDFAVDSENTNLTKNDPVAPAVVAAPPKPSISAEAYLVANLDTGEIYVDYNSSRVFPIASLSKLVTSLVAIHKMNPEQKITITKPMLEAYGTAGHLEEGEIFTVPELLYPLLLESSNDAAEALAQSYGYDGYIQEMNAYVGGLGMTSTSFRDASGLSSGNKSNAKDLFTLARYIYLSEKPLLDLTRQVSYSVASTSEHVSHTWKTINPFPYDPHFLGGKTGRTIEAKESMVSLFRYNSNGVSYPVAIIVLRSEFSDREEDTSLLFSRFIRTVDSSI